MTSTRKHHQFHGLTFTESIPLDNHDVSLKSATCDLSQSSHYVFTQKMMAHPVGTCSYRFERYIFGVNVWFYTDHFFFSQIIVMMMSFRNSSSDHARINQMTQTNSCVVPPLLEPVIQPSKGGS